MSVPVPKDPILFCTTASKKSIRYRVCGANEAKEKVVMVMGLVGPLEAWNEQQSLLHSEYDNFQSLAWDNSGCGLTTRPSALSHSVPIMANDAWELVDALGWLKVHIVSVSMGGMIAQEMTASNPDRVLSLTLINTHAGGFFGTGPSLAGLYNFLRPVFTSSRQVKIECTLNTLFGSAVLTDRELTAKFTQRIQESWKTRPSPYMSGLLAQLSAVGQHWVSKRRLEHIARSGLPVRVFVGKEDILIDPKNSSYLATTLRGELIEYDKCGHGLQIQEASRFVKELVEHINNSKSCSREIVGPAPNASFDHAAMKIFRGFLQVSFLWGIYALFSRSLF
eukprot:TRINITY_DN3225_c0_g1_i1.p1 TRINITY_DN3225_c0_g1~~TRINITY_DN3225_c0_g1_i1.p1  ORF type:complete len:336 (+),score=34.83 TRINITY_DN3225_c0_g1_i1:20-1027(+)